MDFQKYKSSDNHMKIKVLFHFISGKKSPMSICQKKNSNPKDLSEKYITT